MDEIIYRAILKAVELMGPRIKGMSCFVNNWKGAKK